jgi:hypothetical protein
LQYFMSCLILPLDSFLRFLWEGTWAQGFDLDPIHISETAPLKVFVVPHSHW